MGRVNLKIGSIVFDHASYDAESDVLYLRVGAPEQGEGETTPGARDPLRTGYKQDRRPDDAWPASHTQDREGRLCSTIPEAVETTADELADALAAV